MGTTEESEEEIITLPFPPLVERSPLRTELVERLPLHTDVVERLPLRTHVVEPSLPHSRWKSEEEEYRPSDTSTGSGLTAPG
ncbi:hypothetical protein CHS0354_027709, partial [Potamilus streckersoni]